MSLTRSPPLPSLRRMQRRGERKEGREEKKNNAEIMRISKKFLEGGVCLILITKTIHPRWLSSLPLSLPPLHLPPGAQTLKGERRAPGVTARVKRSQRKSPNVMFDSGFFESSQGGAQDLGQGLRVCRSPGHTIFPFALASSLRLKPQQCTWEGNLLSWVLSSLDKKLGAEN